MVKNIGMPITNQNSRELSATKVLSKNAFPYAPYTRVLGRAYGVLRLIIQYYQQHNLSILNVLVTMTTPLTYKEMWRLHAYHLSASHSDLP